MDEMTAAERAEMHAAWIDTYEELAPGEGLPLAECEGDDLAESFVEGYRAALAAAREREQQLEPTEAMIEAAAERMEVLNDGRVDLNPKSWRELARAALARETSDG
jgi:succinate dehydrogenase/fumarate reductase flavoprotein subunit